MANIAATATPKENKEIITLIWFDPNIGKREDTIETQEKLRQINDYVIFYQDPQICSTFIESAKDENIFLITSGRQAEGILPELFHLRQIYDNCWYFQ